MVAGDIKDTALLHSLDRATRLSAALDGLGCDTNQRKDMN